MVTTAEEGTSVEDLEIELLLEAVARRYGYDFRNYAPASLQRRVRSAVMAENLRSVSGLQERILHDPDCLRRFVTRLSVHVTGMFRDPAFYRALRRTVVPMLRTWPFFRVWHAGCSTGEEVYSLAILLEEEGVADRCRIYATDISDDIVQRARRAVFPLRSMRDYTIAYQQGGGTGDFSSYYLADKHHAILREDLRRRIVFSQHNLVSDSSFNEFHLILCRNVMIYFDQDLRRRVYDLLHSSLVRFGVLGLGMRESLRFSHLYDLYDPIEEDLRLYRRVR